MRIDPIVTIAKREYLTRVKSKGFWVATLLLPVAMAALTILPSMIAMKSRASQRLAIVDEAGGYGERLAAKLVEEEKTKPATELEPGRRRKEETAQFKVDLVARSGERAAQRAELDRKVLAGEIDAWLWLSPEGLEKNEVEYHAESVSNFMTQSRGSRRPGSMPPRSRVSPTRSTSKRRACSPRAAGRRAAWPASSWPTFSSSCSTW